MTDRPAPLCPYCPGGVKMAKQRKSKGMTTGRDWYACPLCHATGPIVITKDGNWDLASKAAYEVTMCRAEPVARVMTLDEFTQDENAVYVEDCYGNVEITIMRYIVPMRKPMYLAGSTFERDTCAYEIKTYGKKWRAWTAKPTDAQRAGTAWEA